ncbi:hypothetical protein [Alteromonas sp. H39]|uniref:hypothetical protein n=1 Tax=Alteromonas sp. H39 TaxID=3389876 RepID=UPI0039DF346A
MFKKTLLLSAIIASGMTLSGCVIHVGGDNADHDGANLSSVLGGFDIRDGRVVSDVSTVNGGIDIGNNVTAEDLETVNGGIELGDNVSVRSAEVVNGDIEAGENLRVTEDIETVNGDVLLGRFAEIGDDIETVNGDISLKESVVRGNVETVNGDITLKDNTLVAGDIVYEETHGDWNWDSSVPTLHIDASSKVEGMIILHREVKLDIENDALLGKVKRQYSDE